MSRRSAREQRGRLASGRMRANSGMPSSARARHQRRARDELGAERRGPQQRAVAARGSSRVDRAPASYGAIAYGVRK